MGVLFIALALYCVYKWSSNPLLFSAIAIGLSPTVIYLVSVINPIGLEIASALSFWVTGLLIVKEKFNKIPRALLVFMFLSSITLVLSRSDGPVWALIITAILLFMSKRKIRLELLKTRLFYILSGIWIVCFVVAIAWIKFEHASLVLAGQTYPVGTHIFFIGKSVLGTMYIFINEMMQMVIICSQRRIFYALQ